MTFTDVCNFHDFGKCDNVFDINDNVWKVHLSLKSSHKPLKILQFSPKTFEIVVVSTWAFLNDTICT